jgi:hypothetical protein
MRAVYEHGIECSPSAFWEAFLSPEFSRKYWLEKTGASAYESLLDETSASGDRKRAFKVILGRVDLPAPLAKLFGASLGFVEEGTFDKSRTEYTYRHTYSVLTERIHVGGAISLRPGADGRSVTRIAALDFTVKLLGVGGLAERAADSNFKWGFEAEAAFAADWLKEHPPSN